MIRVFHAHMAPNHIILYIQYMCVFAFNVQFKSSLNLSDIVKASDGYISTCLHVRNMSMLRLFVTTMKFSFSLNTKLFIVDEIGKHCNKVDKITCTIAFANM